MEPLYRNKLSSPRLELRVLKPAQADLVLDYYQLNKLFLKKWSAEREASFYTITEQQNQLAADLTSIRRGQLYRVWIFKKADPAKVIGSISFSNIVRGCFHSCFLGYQLSQSEVKQGYMTEALKTAINYAFSDLRLHRIEANIMPENKASLRVVEKLGFYCEGLAKNYLKINGSWQDHLHLVLLNHNVE